MFWKRRREGGRINPKWIFVEISRTSVRAVRTPYGNQYHWNEFDRSVSVLKMRRQEDMH